MPQSLAQNWIHLVFSTKRRERVLVGEIRWELHRYMAGILGDLDCPAAAVNGVADHVHVLFNLHRNRALAMVVMELKRGSSKWLKARDGTLAGFGWQNGYGAFSVSQSGLPTVMAYIANQEAHHRMKTFEEEFRTLLRRYQLAFDERYVWD
ncbi:MAG: IS200/IS605 family transposase [Limisphaerales bacterium]